MKSVEEVVFNSLQNILKEKELCIELYKDIDIKRENGIDSLSFVTLILDLEDKLDIELEEQLSLIRESKTIGELISIVEEVISNN